MHNFELNNISVETKEKRVATDVSLSMKSGEVHVLMGPNGSGKSSLLSAVFGHPTYKIAAGAVLVDGDDVTAIPTEKKAKRGLFLSMQHIPEIKGVSMLNFLHRAHKELSGKDVSVLDFNKELGAKMEALGIPKEYLRRGVNEGFSGGERKLAEAIQLLALSPKFAFLDEIDSGVDVDSLSKVFAVIDTLKKEGTGFLLITHYSALLKKITPDFVHVMKDGALVRSGGVGLAREIAEKGFN